MPELRPQLGPALARLGLPARAQPGWVGLSAPTAYDTLLAAPVDPLPDAEIACLAVSAVGACAPGSLRPRASLAFQSPEPPFGRDGRTFLEGLVESAFGHGFRVCDAAIVELGAHGTRGFLIGEHSGRAERPALPRPFLSRPAGLARTLWLVPEQEM
jgi:hypothetical protein